MYLSDARGCMKPFIIKLQRMVEKVGSMQSHIKGRIDIANENSKTKSNNTFLISFY